MLRIQAGIVSDTKVIDIYSDMPVKITDAFKERWMKAEPGTYLTGVLYPILVVVKDKRYHASVAQQD